ncbi:MAG: hypothetical protein A3G37_00060 [Omnitrophica WOR_2 bacterium RIFCSPLOWO2_12_FULL_46_30]|nr:MAG: hypothetical protein A3H41_03880 [Omnitrophica WOR_2 bacterium RIFCSPLOWO2_02_FULL_45_28]OGX51500.1 MAG: hypothetical protein A3G37_00060 [Omnitrophica WOR_2 bacterium RIFCSPLOWO2_12_FULL_46_30]
MARKKKKAREIDYDFEIIFFEKLLEKRPSFIQALIALGNVYTQKGDYEKGLEIDLRLKQLRRDDPTVHYNLACSYSLLGRIEDALLSLKRAINLGYEDFDYLLRDPDLENLKKDKRFRHLLKKVNPVRNC